MKKQTKAPAQHVKQQPTKRSATLEKPTTAQASTEQTKPSEPNYSAWKFIVAFLLVAIVIFGISFYVTYKNNSGMREENKYNGFDFAQSAEGYWVTSVVVKGQPYTIPFYYHPRETEDVVFVDGLAEAIVDAPVKPKIVYISLDPAGGSQPVIAGVELSRLFGSRYNLLNMDVRSALTNASDTAVETPIITCDDATDGVLVLFFQQGSMNAVINRDNCVIITYTSSEESVRVADRFAYELLKIM